jgi:hypothetical protein
MLAVKPLAIVAAMGAVAALYGVAVAETAAQVPKDSYYHDPLTAQERSGIAQEESVTPNDGRPSVPNAADDGVIPDAAIDLRTGGDAGPPPSAETAEKPEGGNEADAVLRDSKKDYSVTRKSMADCMKDWGPQTQMTRSEWAASCRTTLEYFPDGQ